MTLGVGGLLLAAGAGSRLGRPKALVEVDGALLVERGISLLADAGLEPRIVVIGAAADGIRRRADLTGAEVVTNAEWRRGMSTSLLRGLDALDGRCAALVIALVDQPLIGVQAVTRLVAAWRAGAVAAVATYDGQPRNPALLDARLWPDLRRSLTGDVGARHFLRSLGPRVVYVDCGDTGNPFDIDTPDDLVELAVRS